MRVVALFAAGVALVSPAASQQPSPAPASADAALTAAPDTRLDSLIAACSSVERDQTIHALLREREFVGWAVRVRLGLGASRVVWDECVLDVTTRALRSCASLTRDEIIAQLFEAPEPMPFAAAMTLLGELGDERDLTMLVDWAGAYTLFTGADEFSSEVNEALRSGCARLAALSAREHALWRRELQRAPEPLRVAIIRGLADAGTDHALARMSEQLGEELVSDAIVLAEIARAARREDRLYDESVRRRVRERLTPDNELRREAALCAGALGDEEAATGLVTLLADPSAGVRSNALWALEHITARRMGANDASWSRWLTSEMNWWHDEAPALLRELAGADARGRVLAASALVSHRFPRHSLAYELAAALPLTDRGAAPIVLAGLRQLGSMSAIAPLERLRPHVPDDAVRADIDATLAALRGQPATRGRETQSQ